MNVNLKRIRKMVKSVNRITLILALTVSLGSCAGEFSSDDALNTIQSEDEFQTQFYAPIYLGSEILTDDNYNNPEGYIHEKYGEIVDAGLITTSVKAENSWRSVVNVTLTSRGKEMVDEDRTESLRKRTDYDNAYYVAVCTLSPERILNVRPLQGDTMEVDYTIIERAITPFGRYLEFSEGREHIHSRKFTKGLLGWSLVPIK